MPASLSLESAVSALTGWIESHGRTPRRKECTNENGLPHFSTLDKLGGLSSLISIVCGCPMNFKPCYKCRRPIPDEGRHVRHCDICRDALLADDTEEYEVPGLLIRMGWFDDEEFAFDGYYH